MRRVDSSEGVMKEGRSVRPGGRDWVGLRGRGMDGENVVEVMCFWMGGLGKRGGSEAAEAVAEDEVVEGSGETGVKKSCRVLRFRDGGVATIDISYLLPCLHDRDELCHTSFAETLGEGCETRLKLMVTIKVQAMILYTICH